MAINPPFTEPQGPPSEIEGPNGPTASLSEFDNYNECNSYPSSCLNGVCVNTVNGYVCQCIAGYAINAESNRCQGREAFAMRLIKLMAQLWLKCTLLSPSSPC